MFYEMNIDEDEEYEKAIEEIVASGRGLEAIKAISQREIFAPGVVRL